MHTLYLLRHAKSSWADPALPDYQRPLAPRGLRDVKRIARHLVRLGIEPELVLCSSAERTRETLELIRPALGATAHLVEAVQAFVPSHAAGGRHLPRKAVLR
jgi:phosphohistidine phosphatase